MADVGGAMIEEGAVAASIRAYIANEFLLGAGDSFEDDSPLVEGGVVDSMGIMEIVDFIEDEFGVRVAQSDLVTANLGSVTQMSAFVVQKLASEELLSDDAAC